MAKRREESDGRTVPEGRRKAVQTVAVGRGGKATTVYQQAGQLGWLFETADSPKGDVAGMDGGRPPSAPRAVPKSRSLQETVMPAMTIEEVASETNLRIAFHQVASNKGAPGPDRQTIDVVHRHLDDLLPRLHRALLESSYRPGNIRRVWIPKAGGGERGLGIPNVIDRIVQQAVHQVLSPVYERSFHGSSHGFRPGRSCHTAIAEARRYLEEDRMWVVDIDLEKFFDRVPHDRLLSRLEQRVSDSRLISLVRKMLKAKVVMPDGVVVSTEEGAPQGGPLSPLLSNIVLDELDHELERRGHRFVRYADDCNIYVRSKRSGERVMATVVKFIEGRLRLKVNKTKSAVARPEERHFLGFRLVPARDGGIGVSVSTRTQERLATKIRELTPRTFGQSLRTCIQGLNAYLLGWVGFFGICTSIESLLQQMDGHIRRRLRALVLQDWGSRRTATRNLIRLGVPEPVACRSLYKRQRAWWALSHSQAVSWGLGLAFFAKQGLVSLKERWKQLRTAPIAPVQLTLELG